MCMQLEDSHFVAGYFVIKSNAITLVFFLFLLPFSGKLLKYYEKMKRSNLSYFHIQRNFIWIKLEMFLKRHWMPGPLSHLLLAALVMCLINGTCCILPLIFHSVLNYSFIENSYSFSNNNPKFVKFAFFLERKIESKRETTRFLNKRKSTDIRGR